MHASCCEGQGTRLFGSLPEFVFSLDTPMNPRIVRVNLYTASSLTFSVQDNDAVVNMSTLWPYESTVVLSLSLPASAAHLVLALRSPEWLPYPLALVVNGATWPATAAPGSFIHITPVNGWLAGVNTVTLELQMGWSVVPYTGHSQLPPYQRAAFLYGPILMSFEGPWDTASDSLVMPTGISANSQPSTWLTSASDGNTLHFNVSTARGGAGYTVRPYFEVQEANARFSNYPCFH